MFSRITSSEKSKKLITELTYKMQLGAENVIARIALGQSLSKKVKLDINKIEDSKGKTYTYNVLLGEYHRVYIAMICQLYQIHKTDPDIGKFVKLHLDDGLESLQEDQQVFNILK
jgi:DNA sulfur modification protein DndE